MNRRDTAGLIYDYVVTGRKQADISAIRQSFFKAESVLNLNGVSFDVPKKNIEYFLKTLSSQSGILNVVNDRHVEKYEFQDSLVKCWLAANYIYRILAKPRKYMIEMASQVFGLM